MPSAKLENYVKLWTTNKSQVCIWKSTGPATEPLETLEIISAESLEWANCWSLATTIQIGRDNVTAFWLNPSAPSLANRWSCGILSNAFDKSVGITAKISLQRSRYKDPLARIFLIFQSLEPENVVQHDLFESRIDILRTITYSFIFCSSLHA